MTNISNDIPTHNSDFIVGDVVVINTPLEFVDGTFDSDDLFTVMAVQKSGVSIWLKDKKIIAAHSELRHASIVELSAKHRLSNSEKVLTEVS